jgi:hypothetical protein|nr:MAG TPA: hypothetical protein [Caudoviricetes sp.]
MSVDEFRSVLDRLRVARMELDDCESLELGDPFIDDAWNAYLTARIDTENAITDLVQELSGFYVLAQISNVHVGGVE